MGVVIDSICLGTLPPSANIKFQVAEEISKHAHYAFSDQSVINYLQIGVQGHSSFSCGINITGAQDSDHNFSFQDCGSFTGSGTLANYASYYAIPNHSGTGVVGRMSGLRISNPLGTGRINELVGVFIENLNRGYNSANWAIKTEGTTPSKFGGAVTIDGGLLTEKTGAILRDVASSTNAKYLDIWNTGSVLQVGIAGSSNTLYTGGTAYAAFFAQANAVPIEFATNGALAFRIGVTGALTAPALGGNGAGYVKVDNNGLLYWSAT